MLPGWYVFYYHDVSDDPRVPRAVRTSPARFASEIVYLRRTFDIVAFSEGLRRLKAGEINAPTASICFDDGFAGVLRHALPVLEKAHVPFILFLNSAFLGGLAVSDAVIARHLGGASNSVRTLMNPARFPSLWSRISKEFDWSGIHFSWDDVASCPSSLAEIGNHTSNHYWLAGLSHQDQWSEIADNHARLSVLPGYQSLLALPFGTSDCFDEATIAANDGVHGDVLIKAVGSINHRRENDRWFIERMGLSDEKPRIDDLLRERVTGVDFGYRARKISRKIRRLIGVQP